jgi:recombination protein RecA
MLRIQTEKVKYGRPFQDLEVPIVFGQGIDQEADLINSAIKHNVIEKRGGGWMTYDGSDVGQGIATVAATLRAHPELRNKITADVMAAALKEEATTTT